MFEPSKEFLRVRAFVENLQFGAYVTYDDIAEATGVAMNERGKAILRRALWSCRKHYRPDIGKGIEIESAQNTMAIVTGRSVRVSNALKKANKTSLALHQRHRAELPDDDKARLDATVSLFGAVMAMADGLKRIYKRQPENLKFAQAGKIEYRKIEDRKE